MLSLCLRIIVTFKKDKGSRSLEAAGAVAFRVRCVLGTAYKRRSPSLSFRCLYPSLIRQKYPCTARSTDRGFQPRNGIKLATFRTVVQRCYPFNYLIVTCNPMMSIQSGPRLTIIPKCKEGLRFKVENFLYK